MSTGILKNNYMEYTIEQILAELKKSEKIEKLYDHKIVNLKEKIDNQYFSEIIAKEILNNISLLAHIMGTTRQRSYRTVSHQIGSIEIRNTNRREENFAKKLHWESKLYVGSHLFKIVDFQVPLKDKQSDSLGKIDLMALNEITSTLYLIELKYGTNKETLLRAILEAHTYYNR